MHLSSFFNIQMERMKIIYKNRYFYAKTRRVYLVVLIKQLILKRWKQLKQLNQVQNQEPMMEI
jgi:hypothetical protein